MRFAVNLIKGMAWNNVEIWRRRLERVQVSPTMYTTSAARPVSFVAPPLPPVQQQPAQYAQVGINICQWYSQTFSQPPGWSLLFMLGDSKGATTLIAFPLLICIPSSTWKNQHIFCFPNRSERYIVHTAVSELEIRKKSPNKIVSFCFEIYSTYRNTLYSMQILYTHLRIHE